MEPPTFHRPQPPTKSDSSFSVTTPSSLFAWSASGSKELDIDVEGVTKEGSSISSNWNPKMNSTLNREVLFVGSHGTRQQTVAERDECVPSDSAYTAAGDKASHQKFLYSDGVEKQLRKSAPSSHVPAASMSFGNLVRSMSSSLSSALDVNAGRDVKMGGSSFSSKFTLLRNSKPKSDARNEDGKRSWTVAERAELVKSNRDLAVLLEAEVEKSGVVTTGGYRAVHQKFLCSEAVEKELRKSDSLYSATSKVPAVPPMSRGNTFGDLVKGMNTHQHQRRSTAEFSSSIDSPGSSWMPQRRSTADFSSSIESPGSSWMLQRPSTGNAFSSNSNFAPRRCSSIELEAHVARSAMSLAEKKNEDFHFQGIEQEQMDSLFAKILLTVSSNKVDERRSGKNIMIGETHLITKEVDDFNTQETIVETKSDDESMSDDSIIDCGSLPWLDERSRKNIMIGETHLITREVDNFKTQETIVEAKRNDESTLDDSDSDCGWLPWPKEQANDMDDQSHGEEDECGWLPWPLEEEN
jgi:hypothetical protein